MDNDLIVEMHNLVIKQGHNITFKCEVAHNNSGRMEFFNQPLDIEWSFSPANSSLSVKLLHPGDMQSNGVSAEGTGTISGSKNRLKYFRNLSTELTIVETAAADAGTYTCRLIQYNRTVSAELYVIGEYSFTGCI